MQQIRPIETEYDGYRFRSRLEARWAVFFNALGVEYEYEPEGFLLPSGKMYLPDFRVKCHGLRGDIHGPVEYTADSLCSCCLYGKGDAYAHEGDCTNKDVRRDSDGYVTDAKCKDSLTVSCPGFRLDDRYPFDLYIEVKGKMTEPDAERIKEFTGLWENMRDYSVSEHPVLVVDRILPEGCSSAYDYAGAYDPMNGTDICPFNYRTIDGDMFAAYPAAHNGFFYLWGDDSNYINSFDVAAVEFAYKEARQARFEHGETPKGRRAWAVNF